MLSPLIVRNRLRYSLALIGLLVLSGLARAVQEPASTDVQPEEAWEAVYIAGQKAGYIHSTVKPVEGPNGERLIEIASFSVIRMKRFGQVIEMEIQTRTVEDLKGQLHEVESIMKTSNVEAMRLVGRVKGDKMELTRFTFGAQQKQEIPWDSRVLGPYAQDRLIEKEQPFTPDKRVEFHTFDPSMAAITRAVLIGGDLEEVQLLDRTETLRHLTLEMYLPGADRPFVSTYLYVDENGEPLKTHTAMLGGMTTYRVDKDTALAEPESLDDIAIRTLIPVEGDLTAPFDTVRVVYRVHLKKGVNPTEVAILDDARQDLQPEDEDTLLLTVRAEPPADHRDPEPDKRYQESNSLLQADNPKIQQYVKQAIGDETDPIKQLRLLERWVYENVKDKNYGVGFASAGAVADSLSGDCTEHAVLLAAMARAAGYPSRVAVGFVYAPSVKQFGGHMWTEVYANGRWHSLDGTLGRGHFDAVHIKLADSALDGADALVSMLPIAKVLDQISKIEVVEVERR